jgi:hypothetical protein
MVIGIGHRGICSLADTVRSRTPTTTRTLGAYTDDHAQGAVVGMRTAVAAFIRGPDER